MGVAFDSQGVCLAGNNVHQSALACEVFLARLDDSDNEHASSDAEASPLANEAGPQGGPVGAISAAAAAREQAWKDYYDLCEAEERDRSAALEAERRLLDRAALQDWQDREDEYLAAIEYGEAAPEGAGRWLGPPPSG
eukprot:1411664-Alexandrium_andersonii.AAC.1